MSWLTALVPYLLVALIAIGAVLGLRESGARSEALKRDLKAREEELVTARSSAADYQQRVLEAQRLAEKRIKTNTVIKTVTKEILREVPVLIPADAPALLPSWRVLHDAAAEGAPADTTAAPGPDARAVPAQEAAVTVIENYGLYHQLANDHRLLQEWVTKECR